MEPASKLPTVRSWQNSTLASELGVEDADEDELYAAMDWLLNGQLLLSGQHKYLLRRQ